VDDDRDDDDDDDDDTSDIEQLDCMYVWKCKKWMRFEVLGTVNAESVLFWMWGYLAPRLRRLQFLSHVSVSYSWQRETHFHDVLINSMKHMPSVESITCFSHNAIYHFNFFFYFWCLHPVVSVIITYLWVPSIATMFSIVFIFLILFSKRKKEKNRKNENNWKHCCDWMHHPNKL
jgi:hypothetical protein